MRRGRIWALYGHTLAGADAQPVIRRDGLLPMRRGHVHLTTNLGYAVEDARAAGTPWVVLRVRSAEPEGAGVGFLATAGHVWLCGAVGPEFLDPIPVARG